MIAKKTSVLGKRGMKIFGFACSPLLSICLLFGLSACLGEAIISSTPEDINETNMVSLRLIYPLAVEDAKKWDSNAELAKAIIEIRNKESDQSIYFFFQIPENQYDYLYLRYNLENDLIQNKPSQYGRPSRNFNPILSTDWAMDSVEAWEIFSKNRDVLSFWPEHSEYVDMSLMRKFIREQEELVWKLSLLNDDKTSLIQISIDANSGEVLEVDIR